MSLQSWDERAANDARLLRYLKYGEPARSRVFFRCVSLFLSLWFLAR